MKRCVELKEKLTKRILPLRTIYPNITSSIDDYVGNKWYIVCNDELYLDWWILSKEEIDWITNRFKKVVKTIIEISDEELILKYKSIPNKLNWTMENMEIVESLFLW